MSDLVSGGAGCGPSNPLQNIGKRFGQDRTTQQDTFASNPYAQQQAPSFRSQSGSGATSSSQPAFFNAPSQQAPFAVPPQDAFDVSQLRGNLPSGSRTPMQNMHHAHHHRPAPGPSMADLEASFRPAFSRSSTVTSAPRAAPSSTAWATDFLSAEASQSNIQAQPAQQMHVEQHAAHAVHPNVIPMGLRMGMMPHAAPSMHFSQPPQQHFSPAQQSATAPQLDNAKWAEAFTAFETSSQTPQAAPALTADAKPIEKADYANSQERDELARTAGRLVSSVEHDQSSKFRQSNFLDLMRKIRDKQAGIHGDNIVENADMAAADAATSSSLDKGKAKAHEPQSQQEAYSWANQMAAIGGLSHLPPSVQRSLAKNNALQSDVPAHLRTQQEIQNHQALNDLWAEEDARSEAIEKQAMRESAQAFVGDGGDVSARMREDDADAREFERYQRIGANIPHASTFNRRWEEDMNRSADQMDDDELDFVGRRWEGTKGRGYPSAQTAEWDKLQSDWDNFEVTSAGIRPATVPQQAAASASVVTAMQPAPAYRFLSDNPYIASTRHHAAHAGGLPAGLESVLEKEAAVQQDPHNASAWYDLGVKQQENEREVQAIAALRKALDLDPNLKDAWLALAVSYTNENDRTAAYEAIEKWIERNDKYRDVAQRASAQAAAAAVDAKQRGRSDSASSHSTSASIVEQHSRLTDLLISMVRSGGERGEIDADVQVALGVIFNSSEDYDKAVDCFSTALSVRPQDWLLYNRLGATLSNSGRSAEAIQYYHHALNLQPEFVRCHFNLSISCLNLKMYQDAAEHIYTALTLQQAEAETLGMANDATGAGGAGGATSGSLWETFRVSLELLNRSDLAAKCSSRDINAFDVSDLVAPVSAVGRGVGEVDCE
ncbi:related to peroxisomal targeting signal receptor [Sporisorium reilianum f. sp. reilianum]|uniref:Related to peroxisomal targeting signal receptor n=1 Tax=Sporisorium reilianum f. sp. reilianum TaxID=72559 RepID=A0A2N8UAX4_9BASI|nr:related to peroxisomal targeting signal receptor [Sporisorium reilianum f. sp. reilianum]